MKTKSWQIGYMATCQDCNWKTDDYLDGNKMAYNHAKNKNHLVHAEKVITSDINGRN